MKKLAFVSGVLLLLCSCTNETSPVENGNVSTVDSAVIDPPATPPYTIDTDNHNLNTDTDIALDSAGPTINPSDTNYNREK